VNDIVIENATHFRPAIIKIANGSKFLSGDRNVKQ